MLKQTLHQLQQGFSLQHLHLLLWFVIAFRARRNAQADRLAAGVLGLPARRAAAAAALPPQSASVPRPPAWFGPLVAEQPLPSFPPRIYQR